MLTVGKEHICHPLVLSPTVQRIYLTSDAPAPARVLHSGKADLQGGGNPFSSPLQIRGQADLDVRP